MLSTLAVLMVAGAFFSTLIVAIVFASKFAVLCLSLLTAYLGTLVYLAVRGRKETAASKLVVLDSEYRRPTREEQQMMLRRVS